jgi:hypothetical protein
VFDKDTNNLLQFLQILLKWGFKKFDLKDYAKFDSNKTHQFWNKLNFNIKLFFEI